MSIRNRIELFSALIVHHQPQRHQPEQRDEDEYFRLMDRYDVNQYSLSAAALWSFTVLSRGHEPYRQARCQTYDEAALRWTQLSARALPRFTSLVCLFRRCAESAVESDPWSQRVECSRTEFYAGYSLDLWLNFRRRGQKPRHQRQWHIRSVSSV